MSKLVMILVAVGANLPRKDGTPALQTCRWAVSRMAALPDLRLARVSRWYRSRPVPASDQPDYVNGMVRLETAPRSAPRPADLLVSLQAIEAEAGRVRGARNAARVLDLDIIDIGGMRRSAPDPVLPHPRAAERAFVLLPLRDVAPDWREPGSRRRLDDLLAALRDGCGEMPVPLE